MIISQTMPPLPLTFAYILRNVVAKAREVCDIIMRVEGAAAGADPLNIVNSMEAFMAALGDRLLREVEDEGRVPVLEPADIVQLTLLAVSLRHLASIIIETETNADLPGTGR